MPTALITGATGFLGSSLARFLAAHGYRVAGTTTGTSQDQLHQCDIAIGDALDDIIQKVRPDVVVHCAAISSVTGAEPLEYYATNVVGTQNLLTSLSKLSSRVRLILISTAGVYGNQKVEFLHEELAPLPVHHYGMSKFCSERLVYNYANSIDFTICRPFNIIGSGQNESFILPKLVAAFGQHQRNVRLGNTEVFRDFIGVDGACSIIHEMIDCKASFGQVVNLCTGTGTSLRQIIDMLQRFAGYEIEIIQAPEFTRKSEVWRLLGSCEKLNGLLPRRAQLLPLESVVLQMYEHYRKKQEA